MEGLVALIASVNRKIQLHDLSNAEKNMPTTQYTDLKVDNSLTQASAQHRPAAKHWFLSNTKRKKTRPGPEWSLSLFETLPFTLAHCSFSCSRSRADLWRQVHNKS